QSRWESVPLTMVPSYASNLKRMAIAFDAGTNDGFRDIPANVQRLDSLLISLGVAHEAELYEGTHGSRIRSRLESKAFPFFSKALH
ncbi:MAG: esterase, partial [Gemmatimonadaceae bacterium]